MKPLALDPASAALLLPMAALALLTLLILLLVPFARVRGVRAGHLTIDDFKHGESTRVPSYVALPNRVFMNLLEVPVLFYLACVVAVVTGQATALLATLAWAYVALRVLHALIYLSYNHVLHRLAAFAASNGVAATMWVIIGWRLLPA